MKKTLRRTLAIMLMLVMLVGLFPNSIVTPAYAYASTATHRLQLNLPYANMRGGITNIGQLGLKNRITGVYNSNAMEGINNHSFDYDTPAFCINPVAGSTPGASYGYKGDGRSASEYWNSFSDYDKQVVSLIVEYYENHPTSSYNSIGDNVYWLAKMGAQVAIFLFVMDASSQETMRNALSRRMWDDVLDYAFELKGSSDWSSALKAYSYALEQYRDDAYAPFLVLEIVNIHKDHGRYDEAIQCFYDALEIPAVADSPDMLAEFEDSMIYLEATKEVLISENQPDTPFFDIPKDYMSKIESIYNERKARSI